MRSLRQLTLDLFGADPAPAPAHPQLAPACATDGLPDEKFSHPLANRHIRLGPAMVGYVLQRSQRRTLGFMVNLEGLVVRAPRWAGVREVESALQQKAGWILRKLADMQRRGEQLAQTRIEWRDGATLPYLGEPLQLCLDPEHRFAGKGAALVRGGEPSVQQLRLALPRQASSGQIQDAVQAWLMRQARDNFQMRLQHFAPQLQVQWRRLSLSNAATRWGSASADGSIRLNWRLIHVRQPIIDYVVVHELSHLRVMDHSPRFWDTVGTVVPDYAQLRAQLKAEPVPRWS